MRHILWVLALLMGALALTRPAEAAVTIKVDLSTQTMNVTTTDGEAYVWKVSSGRSGYRTIRGTYKPYRMEKNWYSRKYGGAMPHAMFFRGGFAIHGTTAVGALGRPASHGCVRLHPANAAKLFALVKQHGAGATQIAIQGTPEDSPTRYAKAKTKATTQLAKQKAQSPDWQTARGQILLKPTLPPSALGYTQPGPSPWLR